MVSRYERLARRRIDSEITAAKQLNEVYRSIEQSESVRYVIGTMQPIDPEYTANTYEQGRRVCNQLQKRLSIGCEYKYQGSVTNDTHIRARSDIDVLAIIKKFFSLEKPQKPISPYKGDPIQDLLELREECIGVLSSAFPEATLDSSGSKSIQIEGGSLRRKVDVVPSNWRNTNKYAETSDDIYRGVHVLDAKSKTRLANTPFLHNAWIEHKDKNTNGGMRKAARLLKSLKYDSERISLSSYDLVSIAFSIPEPDLAIQKGGELTLLDSCNSYCAGLLNNPSFRDTLLVPDEHRKIFAPGHATEEGLSELVNELSQLVTDVLSENQRSFRKLAEARVDY